MTTTFKRFLFTALFAGTFPQAQAVKLEGTIVKGPHDSKTKFCHLTLSPGPHLTDSFNSFRDKYLKNTPIQTITLSDGPDEQNEAGHQSGYHHLTKITQSLSAQNPASLAETGLTISGKSPLIQELLKGNRLYVDIAQNLIHAREEVYKTKALEANTEPGVVQRLFNTVKPKRHIQELNPEESAQTEEKVEKNITTALSAHTPIDRPLPPSGCFVYINGISAVISADNMRAFNSTAPTYYRAITFGDTVTGSAELDYLKYLEDSIFSSNNAGKVAYTMLNNNRGASIRWYGSTDPITAAFPNAYNQLDVINLIKDYGPSSASKSLAVSIIGPDTSGTIETNTQHGKYYTSLEYANSKTQLGVPFGPIFVAVATDQLTTTHIYGQPQLLAIPAGIHYPVSPSSALGADDLLKQTHKIAPNEYSFYFKNIELDNSFSSNINTLDSNGTWKTELSKLYKSIVADCPADIYFTNEGRSVIADLENSRLNPEITLTNLQTTTAPADATGSNSQPLGFSINADDSYDATQDSSTLVKALWFMNMLPKGKGEIVHGDLQTALNLTSSATTGKITLTIGDTEYAMWNGVATIDSAASRNRVGSLLDQTVSLPGNLQIKKRTIKE